MKYIYINRDENSCRSRTRNVGWKAADGKIIIFIDSDIIVRSDYLSEVERCFNIDGNILLYGTRLMLQEDIAFDSIRDGSVYKRYYFSKNNKNLFEQRHYVFNNTAYNSNFHMLEWIFVFSCNMVMPKKVLEKIDGFDEFYKKWGGEDNEIAYNALINGCKIISNYRLEVLHQNHPQSQKGNTESMIENHKYFIKKHPEAETMSQDHFKYLLSTNEGEEFSIQNFMEKVSPKIREKLIAEGKIKEPKEIIHIQFKKREEEEDIKKAIQSNLHKEGALITVVDYVENTDIDIWIQLLGKSRCKLRYFPASRKFSPSI